MTLLEFLRRVLPQSGVYFACSPKKERGFNQYAVHSIEELAEELMKLSKERRDAYFATSSYAGTHSRESKAAVFKRAIYLDIDCGPNKPYKTKKEGALALEKFCKDAAIPLPPVIIDSGNGLHTYWPLSHDAAPRKWLPVATSLKKLCARLKFHVDPTITTDVARILRAPGTVNYKNPAHPKPCRVVANQPTNYTLDEFANFLSAKPAPDNSDLSANLPAKTFDYRPRFAKVIARECGVLRRSIVTGGKDQPGQLWSALLHLLAFCEDGHEYAHLVSKGYAAYTPEETNRRFSYSVGSKERVGPTKCETLEAFMPEECKRCVHSGRVTSPLQLGVELEDVPPFPYFVDEKGVWRRGEEGDEPILVCPYAVSNFQVFRANEQLFAAFEARANSGPVRHVTVQAEALMGTGSNGLPKSLSQGHMILNKNQIKEVTALMTSWMQQLQMSHRTKKTYGQLGWVESHDQHGFVTGPSVFWSDGSSAAAPPVDAQLHSRYLANGDPQVWKDSANFLLSQHRPAVAAAIASAFAAPLVKFTGVNGCVLSIYSARSGTGKTTALSVAQAVWGHPLQGMNSVNDTPAAVARKLGYLNNLPVYWDELRMKENIQLFVKLLFQLTQGKERERLRSDSSMHTAGSWNSLVTVATNESLLDYVDANMRGTEAGRVRVLELELTDTVPPLESGSMGLRSIQQLPQHFGHAGQEYAAWLVANRGQVEKAVHKQIDKLNELLNPDPAERFRVATAATLMVGAAIATKLEIARFNMPELNKFLLDALRVGSSETKAAVVKNEQVEAYDLLVEYLTVKADHGICTNKIHVTGGRPPLDIQLLTPNKREPILFQYDEQHTTLLLSKRGFKEWLVRDKTVMPTPVLRALTTQHKAMERRVTLGAGAGVGLQLQQPCLMVLFKNLKIPPTSP